MFANPTNIKVLETVCMAYLSGELEVNCAIIANNLPLKI